MQPTQHRASSRTIRPSRWEPFVAWLQTLEFLPRWTATLETSLRSGLKDRLHLHVFMEFNKAVDWTGLRAVTFNGIRPNAQATAGRGAKMRELKNHGHFYVFADKVGTLKVATSGYEPWKDYPVKGRSQVRLGFLGRLKQVETVRFHERLGERQAQQIATEQRLQALKRPFRPEVLAALQPWAAQYSTDQLRYKFLVLRGGSHGYILFDNVNDMQFVLDHRALVQSNNSVHRLGRVWLFKVPTVVTVDDSAVWDSNEPWIHENMFELILHGPCYE
ncbi:unnamed protein product [Symbiodinium necroappetens]|uniref:Uncharacterized protein n=1 Tax=Symbiodinium necroappetens TaxID=1628268 RepID=A0A812TG03_9DINO|nr:unnamed protein product [Symbiodinium necroappetens]